MSGETTTYRLVLAYEGTDFAGWQIQPGKRTVQGQLERLLSRICESRVTVVGSGRTDAGVHARGQVAAARIERWTAGSHALLRALRGHSPPDLSILSCEEVPSTFHPIRDATGKRYEYRMRFGGPPDPFKRRWEWHLTYDMDFQAMCEASRCLIGRHDFRSFQTTGSTRKSSVRTVRLLEFDAVDEGPAGMAVCLSIEADGFLYNMVRNIVGSLVYVGRGRRTREWVHEALLQRDRQASGPAAPPHGLCLVRVDYDSVNPVTDQHASISDSIAKRT